MAKRGSTARKRERERMKVERAALKRERRDQRKSEKLEADTDQGVEGEATLPEGTIAPEAADRQAPD